MSERCQWCSKREVDGHDMMCPAVLIEKAESERDEVGIQLVAARSVLATMGEDLRRALAAGVTFMRERDRARAVAHGVFLRRHFDDDHSIIVALHGEIRSWQHESEPTPEEPMTDMTERLSPHFTLSELCRSSTAERRGISNIPPPNVVKNLRALCEQILEPLRLMVGRSVVVSSGYRSPELNLAVGGNAQGQHPQGEAADLEVPGVDNLALAKLIRGSGLPFDQLILEFHTIGSPSSGWIHLSHSVARANRGQVLTAALVNGKTVYETGLPDDE